jgi:hypothetical protein
MPGKMWSERRIVIGLNVLNGEWEMLSDFPEEVYGSLAYILYAQCAAFILMMIGSL